MERTRLYLIRHGQVVGHEHRRYNGQGNVALTERGREQARAVCAVLAGAPLAAVYSSDLDRCTYGARLLAEGHGLPLLAKKNLRELHIGEWEGRTWEELQRDYPTEWQARLDDLVNFRVPGGESLLDAAERVRPALQQILAQHRGDDLALVAHGGVNRIILLDAIGAPLARAFSIEQDFGCLNMIDYFHDGNAVVRLLNGAPGSTLCGP